MGCSCNVQRKIITPCASTINSPVRLIKKGKFNIRQSGADFSPKEEFTEKMQQKYFNKLSLYETTAIFSFLNFKELKEFGKCNLFFKRVSSNPSLLKKFFTKQKVKLNYRSDYRKSTCCTNKDIEQIRGNCNGIDLSILIEKYNNLPTFKKKTTKDELISSFSNVLMPEPITKINTEINLKIKDGNSQEDQTNLVTPRFIN